jgi:hypothetical protein
LSRLDVELAVLDVELVAALFQRRLARIRRPEYWSPIVAGLDVVDLDIVVLLGAHAEAFLAVLRSSNLISL